MARGGEDLGLTPDFWTLPDDGIGVDLSIGISQGAQDVSALTQTYLVWWTLIHSHVTEPPDFD